MRQTRRLRVNAPVARVWELIDDDSKLPLWMPHIIATRYPQGKPKDNPVGTRFIQEMHDGDTTSTYEGEVTEYEAGTLLGVILRPQAFVMHVVYHVSGDDDWTVLEYGCDVHSTSWKGRLMLWLGRKTLNAILDQTHAKFEAADKRKGQEMQPGIKL